MASARLSLVTDGLNAEREQGITIDVAYRYFATPKRRFIIADTPGHEQYTRNMATGASTADLAVILIDARLGILTQSKRHALHRVAAGRAARRGGGQQDGSGRLRPGRLRPHPRRVRRVRGAAGIRRPIVHSDERAGRRQRGDAQATHAMVRRRPAACRTSKPSTSPATEPDRLPLSRAARGAARTRTSAATRAGRVRRRAPRRRSGRPSLRAALAHHAHRRLRTGPSTTRSRRSR